MKLVIDQQEFTLSQLPELIKNKRTQVLSDWEDALFSFLDCWFDKNDSICAHSSGSTGEPKTLYLSKKQMMASALLTNQYFHLHANDSLLLCLSANYIAGKMMIVRALMGNLRLVANEPCSCPLINQAIEMAAMVPMQVETLLETAEGIQSLQKIKQLIIGGSAISKNVEEKLQLVSTACYATYGMTETVSHIALRRINGSTKSTEYRALNGVHFEQDERDCLVIFAPHLQKEAFVTNDIVKLNSSESFEWMGRYDNVINSGGVKLFPELIEAKISDLIEKRFYISSLPDNKLGEKLVLVIENERFKSLELENLKIKLKEILTRYELPRDFIFIPHFIETSNGKVKRIIYPQ